MKKNKPGVGKLELGRELSKNAQKQILGGITIVCQYGTYSTQWGSDCTGQESYCPAAGHGYFIACYPWG